MFFRCCLNVGWSRLTWFVPLCILFCSHSGHSHGLYLIRYKTHGGRGYGGGGGRGGRGGGGDGRGGKGGGNRGGRGAGRGGRGNPGPRPNILTTKVSCVGNNLTVAKYNRSS